MEDLYQRAVKKDLSILQDPDCSVIAKDAIFSPLHWLAWMEKVEILQHPDCSTNKDTLNNMTPLHVLAEKGKIEVLQHPDCSKVKDNSGMTPLHWLADKGVTDILQHPDCSVVKDCVGRTPLHILVQKGLINALHLKKLFPWYTPEPVSTLDLEQIFKNMPPQSIRFIMEE